MPGRLVIVIVTYNSRPVLEGLLDSLAHALAGTDADIVVVDNGSTDGTQDLVESNTTCTLVRSSNIGYAGGLNKGVESSSARGPILVLNPDVRLHAGAIVELMGALRVPRTGIAAPKILNDDGTVFKSLRREPSLLRASGFGFTGASLLSEHVQSEAAYLRSSVVDWALGAVLLMSRECYEEIGGWDDSYFLYSEETDFCLSARDVGWQTRFVPSAVATHIGGQSGRNDDTHVIQILNRIRLYRRRNSVFKAWIYYLLVGLSEATWVMRGHRQSRAALRALVHRTKRPSQLRASDHMMIM